MYILSLTDFKLYITKGAVVQSPWHDIPLIDSVSGLYNMVVEIPMFSSAKMEVMKNEINNPVMQDVKDMKPRYI
jgi:inorganic pyrophosphatase